MQKREVNKILRIAESSFVNKEYIKAMNYYSKLLSYIPNQDDAKIGVMLCDIAMDKENEDYAQSIFDFYTINKIESSATAFKNTKELINSLDNDKKKFDSVFTELFGNKIEEIDGHRGP